MLVLTRREGESLKIDGDIEVMVLGIRGGQVKIGIKAPEDVKVFREELFERMMGAVKKLAAIDEKKAENAEIELVDETTE